ncbi:hypothetical protein ACTMTI_40890 [Nonomuraea sp. H19]
MRVGIQRDRHGGLDRPRHVVIAEEDGKKDRQPSFCSSVSVEASVMRG